MLWSIIITLIGAIAPQDPPHPWIGELIEALVWAQGSLGRSNGLVKPRKLPKWQPLFYNCKGERLGQASSLELQPE